MVCLVSKLNDQQKEKNERLFPLVMSINKTQLWYLAVFDFRNSLTGSLIDKTRFKLKKIK